MVLVAFVEIHAVMFERSCKAPGKRLIVWCLRNICSHRHRSNQIAGEFLGTLSAYRQTRQTRRAVRNCLDQATQTVIVAIRNMHQLMSQHANHAFIRRQTGKKYRAEGDRMWPTEKN